MKIELDLDYDEAIALRDRLKRGIAPDGDRFLDSVAGDIASILDDAIQNEDEKRAERSQELAFDRVESADIKYKESLADGGRAHLLR